MPWTKITLDIFFHDEKCRISEVKMQNKHDWVFQSGKGFSLFQMSGITADKRSHMYVMGAEVFYPHFINRFAYHTNDHIDAVIVIIAIISLSYLLPKFKKATWRPELTYQYFRLTMSCGWCERDIWFLYKPCQARDSKTTNWPEPFAVWTNCKARLLLLRIRELVRRVRLLLEQVNQMRQW